MSLIFIAVMTGCAVPVQYQLDQQKPITLSGILTVEEFYGPPGYGETPKIDSIARPYILVLDAPVNVIGDLSLAIGADHVGTISTVLVRKTHLAGGNFYDDAKSLVGKHITVTGKFFPAHTGHHHTAMLFDVVKDGIRETTQ